jgi:membrane protein YdbS with pleckstrin-like domain
MERDDVIETDDSIAIKYFSVFGSQVSALAGFVGPLIIPNEIISDKYFLLTWAVSSILLGLLYYFLAAPFIAKLQAQRERYWFNDEVLYVNSGLFFKRRISIIPRNITDITIAQGPILAFFNLWVIKIQTAGKGDHSPEVKLVGVINMESLKNQLLKLAK